MVLPVRLTWGSSCSSRPRVGPNRSARRGLRSRVGAGGRAAAAAEAARSAPCAAARCAASRPTSAALLLSWTQNRKQTDQRLCGSGGSADLRPAARTVRSRLPFKQYPISASITGFVHLQQRKSAQPDWTEPAHRFPPGTKAQNRFFHVRTVRILLRTRRAPQLQPRPTASKFAGPAGAAEPNRTDPEDKEERGSEARAGEPLSSVTGSVLQAGGVTRGRSSNPGTVTAQSDVTRSDGPKGKQGDLKV